MGAGTEAPPRRAVTGPAGAAAMCRALGAGLAYGSVLFGAGFVLGTLRVILVAPSAGETVAIGLELPVMLAIAWLSARALAARWNVPPKASARWLMGSAGLTMLLALETAMSVAMFGRSLAEHMALYGEPLQWIGLVAQVSTATFPTLAGRGQRP